MKWVAERVHGQFANNARCIELTRRDKIVAGVVYENWNKKSIMCHIAVEGLLTPKYLWLIFDYPFNQLGVSKIIAPIAEGNEKSIRFVSKLGFRKEAQILDAHPDGSLLIYTMTREQCRFIGDRYGQRYKLAAGN